MSSSDIETLCIDLEKQFKDAWMSRPEEIKKIENLTGAFGYNYAVHHFSMADAEAIIDFIWQVRSTVKQGQVPLDSAETLLGAYLITAGDKWKRYYKIQEFPTMLNRVGSILPKVSSKEQFFKMVDLVLLYVGRYNDWLDADLDWNTLSQTHETLRKKTK
jgi:hypothetical protein